jgi:hypothetical protein
MPLSVALDAFGWIGCHAYVTPDIGDFRLLGTNGIDRGDDVPVVSRTVAPRNSSRKRRAPRDKRPWPIAAPSARLATKPLVAAMAAMGYAATQKHQLRLF